MTAFNPIFSQGADNAIALLNPGPRPRGIVRFPFGAEWEGLASRFASEENPQHWFRRIIGPERQAEERIGQCGIENNVAFFATVKWDDGLLKFCRLQLLVTMNGDLLDYYLGQGDTKGTYCRLDLDASVPGPLFKEPLPHIHCIPDGPPRFAFMCPIDEYLPITFLEFVYLNFQHDKWLNWARTECSCLSNLPFESIVAHFNKGTIKDNLHEFRSHLELVKRILFRTKRHRIRNAPHIDPSLNDLNYRRSALAMS